MKCLRALIVAGCFAVSLTAQTAAIAGHVLDPSGAVVPSARVELVGPGQTHSTTSSRADGSYSLTGLMPGNYSATASANHLATARPAPISLHAGEQTLDLVLAVETTVQQATVQEDANPTVGVETTAGAGATAIAGDNLRSLADDMEDLQADLIALAGPSAGPGDAEILIDGFSYGQLPTKESIREIRINQNPFSPEYDKIGLGRVEIFTKPGTSRFHGATVYNAGAEALNSRNPYAAQKAPFLLQESENTLTGPLTKRTQFTFGAEYQIVDDGSVTNAIVLAPGANAPTPFTSVVSTPQRRYRVLPRTTWQLGDHNALSLGYALTLTDVHNAGIGSFDLPSRGYRNTGTYNTLTAVETSLHGSTVNETRALLFYWNYNAEANSDAPKIAVLGAFNSGGAVYAYQKLLQRNYELQNNTYILRGRHAWRFGARLRAQTYRSALPFNFNGTFTFDSIQRYQATVQGLPGSGASLFTIGAGTPGADVYQVEPSAFAGDDWRLKPNLTLSLGLRFESQNNIRDHADFAPRIGFAWAPGGTASKPGKTVVRGGFGVFYDRFTLSNTLTAHLENGIVQQQYAVMNPDFFLSNTPSVQSLAANSSGQIIREVDSRLRTPYLLQSAIAVERQLTKGTTLAATYSSVHGLHELRTDDINPPEPGTYSGPGTGVYPYPGQGPILLLASAGLYNQNQLIFNLNTKLNSAASLFSSYTLNQAMSNTDGATTSPGNPYNYSGDYGPASTDVRHRLQFGGSINSFWNVSLNPLVILQSGAPFDITTGEDPYGTTLYFARPGIAANPGRPDLVQTAYGLLDPNPSPGETILGRNAGRGPGLFSVNLRVSKAWGFGPERSGSPATRKYNLSLGVSARNLLNHTNQGPIVGVVTSPLFGTSNQLAGAGTTDNAGFTENAGNRRLEMQLRLAF